MENQASEIQIKMGKDANDWEDFTAHVHKNLLDEYADAMKQKEELEQSEADDIQEEVDHIHILYVNDYAQGILDGYRQFPKNYHIHHVEMSEEFMSDIAQKDFNEDMFTFQYSPATDTAPIMTEVPNLSYESLSATKPDVGEIFENEEITIPPFERDVSKNENSVTANKKNKFGKLGSKLEKWTAIHFPQRKAKDALELTEHQVENGIQGARENQEQQNFVENPKNYNVKHIKKKTFRNFGRKIKSWFLPKTNKEQKGL
ncbi:hypothetical protein OUZ56_010007 [Daphnia magna]|uniref:Uncharacterized protein n=1 Tax=Daphnia magna TaxID=35525 RepID=A0ABR0AHI7_9CRUS|nr:hypothetical protein OUZ56_010007 [Daphnia magna]